MKPDARFRLSGLVLAGGGSRRMGQDKALLVVDFGHGPRPLLAHALATLGAVEGVEDLVVAGGHASRHDAYAQAAAGAGIGAGFELRFVDDGAWVGAGPLAGLAAGFAAARAPLTLALAVDALAVPSAVFERLVERHPGGAVVKGARGVEPLLGVYPTQAAGDAATRLLAEGRQQARGLAEALVLPQVEAASFGLDEDVLASANSPQDLEKLAAVATDRAQP